MLFRFGHKEMHQQHDAEQPDNEGGDGDRRIAAAKLSGWLCIVHRFAWLEWLRVVALASMIAHGVGEERHSHCAKS